MGTVSRRQFVAWVSSALPIAIVARHADALAAAWIADDAETLRALAEAVLPSELGRDGTARIARDFQRWIDHYREHAEIVHGYGTSALRFTGPSPRAKWAVQLETLGNGKSETGNRTPFKSLSLDRRRAIVAEELKGEKADRMPDVASAPHVALGLLAFFYGSSEAADMAYGAKIGRLQCRPLALSSRLPQPYAVTRT